MTVFMCPLCGKKLVRQDKSLVCETGHCFDVAKSGYVNLLPVGGKNSLQPGDNKEMIAARKRVMAKGYYAPLAAKIIELLKETGAGAVLDAGCGTGYIPSEVQRAFPTATVVGTDISKFAVEAAAKLNKQVQFAVASSMRLPLEERYFDAVLCAFAPVYAGEFARVTKDNGYLLRVVPAEEHLYKLKEFLYETPRKNEEDETSFVGYEPLAVHTVNGIFTGDREDISALVKMTPYYYHTSEEKLKKLDSVDMLTVNTSFEVRVFRKK